MDTKYIVTVQYVGLEKPVVYRNVTAYKYDLKNDNFMTLMYPVKKKEKTIYILLDKVLNFSIEEME